MGRRPNSQHPYVSTYHRKDVRAWYCRWRDADGVQHHIRMDRHGCYTPAEREAFAQRISRQIAMQRQERWAPAETQVDRAPDDLATARESYLESTAHLADETRKTNARHSRFVVEAMQGVGITHVSQITVAALTKLRTAMLARWPGTTGNIYLSQARALIAHWRRIEITALDADRVRDALRGMPTHQKRARALTREQCIELVTDAVEYARKRPQALDWVDWIALVLLTGLRRAETVRLEWEHVDLERERLEVRRTKTHRDRWVTLGHVPVLVERLAARRKRCEGWRWVFGETRPMRSVQINGQTATLKRVRWSPQGLRQTCASWLVNGRWWGDSTMLRACEELGHTVTVAQKRYWRVVEVPAHATRLDEAMGVAELLRP